MRTQNDLQRFAERDIRQLFVDIKGGRGARGVFHVERVKDDVNVLTFFAKLTLDIVNPVFEGEIRVGTAVDVDLDIERFRNALFFRRTREVRLTVFLSTNFGKVVPNFGIRIGYRRFVADRNVSAFDGHKGVEKFLLAPNAEILIFGIGVG